METVQQVVEVALAELAVSASASAVRDRTARRARVRERTTPFGVAEATTGGEGTAEEAAGAAAGLGRSRR